jgi:hypothetical protein
VLFALLKQGGTVHDVPDVKKTVVVPDGHPAKNPPPGMIPGSIASVAKALAISSAKAAKMVLMKRMAITPPC